MRRRGGGEGDRMIEGVGWKGSGAGALGDGRDSGAGRSRTMRPGVYVATLAGCGRHVDPGT